MYCQLEGLRHCLPPSVRRTLSELPNSLDETYERMLKEIKTPNKDHALRLFQCLVVAIRPLRVEELAEVLAVDFDAEGIPKLNPSWRWEDEEQALLSSCSSLISIVDEARIVQFSHFLVKEFLTSHRLAASSGDVSRYHIVLEPAHAILAHVSLSVLLRWDDRIERCGIEVSSPLAGYAATHWVTHTQFDNVSSHVRKAMESLFDPDKPHFAAWLRLHDMDIDRHPSPFFGFTQSWKSDAVPLYYAALCGFQDLAERLIDEYPSHVNARGGYYLTPVVAALAGRHFQLAQLLHRHGSSVDPRGEAGWSPLHSAAFYGDLEMVGILLEHKADIEGRTGREQTPLHSASRDGHRNDSKIVRLLLEHGANPNARTMERETPLHLASEYERPEVARLLLEQEVDINAGTMRDETPLHRGSKHGSTETVRLLLEHCADPNARMTDGSIPLHRASEYGSTDVARLLLKHGASVEAKDRQGKTALQVTLENGHRDIMKLLLEQGAEGKSLHSL